MPQSDDPTITPEFRALGVGQPLPKKNRRKYVKDTILKEIDVAFLHPVVAVRLKKEVAIRSELGYTRYGTYLQPHNGRNWLIDLKEELLDALFYATQGNMEGHLDSDDWSNVTYIDREVMKLLNRVMKEIIHIETIKKGKKKSR
jgi:hypothetical protein